MTQQGKNLLLRRTQTFMREALIEGDNSFSNVLTLNPPQATTIFISVVRLVQRQESGAMWDRGCWPCLY